ncbi:MAG: hypothetical protein ACI391_02495, partial [Muribaculaceae bacterium]
MMMRLFTYIVLALTAASAAAAPAVIELSSFPASVEDLQAASPWLNQSVQGTDTIATDEPIPFATFGSLTFVLANDHHQWSIFLSDTALGDSTAVEIHRQWKEQELIPSVRPITFKSADNLLVVVASEDKPDFTTCYYAITPHLAPYPLSTGYISDGVPFSAMQLIPACYSEHNILPPAEVNGSIFQLQNDADIDIYGANLTWHELTRFNHNGTDFRIISRSDLYSHKMYIATGSDGHFPKLLMIYYGQLPPYSGDAQS